MGRTEVWLGEYPWEFVVEQNSALCAARQALHKPTSDGYEPCKNAMGIAFFTTDEACGCGGNLSALP